VDAEFSVWHISTGFHTGILSSKGEVKVGSSQGSILGPLLFSTYVNDLLATITDVDIFFMLMILNCIIATVISDSWSVFFSVLLHYFLHG